MNDRRRFLAAAAACTLSLRQDAAPARKPPRPRTVVLVRHGEKAAAPADDPPLTEVGTARAEALARMLGHSGVTHLFATEFTRTQATLAPLAKVCGVTVTTIAAADGRGLAEALHALPEGAVAVVAGHSNTIPPLVQRLSRNEHRTPLTEADYDRVFVLTRIGDDLPPALLELRSTP